MARLARAFSLRRGLRSLLHPRADRLAPVDGLRALSILWVIGFHSVWYLVGHLPPARYLGLVGSPFMLPLWRGDFGVDVFFVLSGFLIGGLLLDERERTGRLRVGRFYLRRFLRLWPALLVAVVLDQALFRDLSAQAWAPLLYLTNALSVAEVPLAWTWSLSIEEQFYLICPWLLAASHDSKEGARLVPLALLAIALSGLGAFIVVSGHHTAGDVELAVNRAPGRWIAAHDALYSRPWMRAGPLLAGVAAAVLWRRPAAMAALARAHLATPVLLFAALGLALVSTHWPFVEHAPRLVEVLYLACFRSAFGLAVACLLLVSLCAHPLGLGLGSLLSWRPLFPIAQLAYSAYLLNPIVTMLVYPRLLPHAPTSSLGLIGLVLAIELVLSFAAALPLYLLVERPFMELRRAARPN